MVESSSDIEVEQIRVLLVEMMEHRNKLERSMEMAQMDKSPHRDEGTQIGLLTTL